MLERVDLVLSGVAVPLLLTLCGAFMLIKLRRFHILRPSFALRAIRDGGSESRSALRALSLALAGTLGVGNIVGVASAIYLGGFGAIAWMWVSAILAMALKYSEIALAIRHRRLLPDGSSEGSAMYYIRDRFRSLGSPRLGGALASVFAVLFLLNALCMGGMLQADALAEAVSHTSKIPSYLTGIILATVVLFVVIKGTNGIAALTQILVPLMSLGYTLLALLVIFRNLSELGDAFYLIFSSALDGRAAVSGVGGFAVAKSIRYGFMRGLVSNEAGCGTAPAAHAVSSVSVGAKQGAFGIVEVFVDTLLLCTATALVLILRWDDALVCGGGYMNMVIRAFCAELGDGAAYFIAAAVVCFALATILCWGHYGLLCVKHFHGGALAKNIFTVSLCVCVMLGCVLSADICWRLSDICMSIMTLINLSVLLLSWRDIREETETYLNTIDHSRKLRSKK